MDEQIWQNYHTHKKKTTGAANPSTNKCFLQQNIYTWQKNSLWTMLMDKTEMASSLCKSYVKRKMRDQL